jgi:MYXO-CTERM domain-containing protein
MVTGASATFWNGSGAEIFAADASGTLWHDWATQGNQFNKWKTWSSLSAPVGIASRPALSFSSGGFLNLFARGVDGQLYHAKEGGQGQSASFSVFAPGTFIQGEPSVVETGHSPTIFARDVNGKVIRIDWDETNPPSVTKHFDQDSASDPFVWIRGDGDAEVFAIDPNGALQHSYRNGGVWSDWAPIGGSGLAPCVFKLPPPPADAGPDTSGSGGGGAGPSSTASSGQGGAGHGGAGGSGGNTGGGGAGKPTAGSGCACRAGAADDASTAWSVYAWPALGLLLLRRRRGQNPRPRPPRAQPASRRSSLDPR